MDDDWHGVKNIKSNVVVVDVCGQRDGQGDGQEADR